MEELYVGVDVGKSVSVVFAMAPGGEVVLEKKRVVTPEVPAWRALLKELRASYELHIAFEIGPHYGWMSELFTEYSDRVVVVNAAAFAVISKSHRKTDKLDAQRLAEGLLRGDLPSVYVPDEGTRSDRQLVAFAHDVSQQMSAIKCRIRGLLQGELLDCPGCDVLSPSGIAWLTEEALPRLREDRALPLRLLMAQGQLLRSQQKVLRTRIKERVKCYPDAKLLDSIPGFGPLVTLAVLSAVGSIRRFESPKELAAYFGVCPRVRVSGHSSRLGAMTKRGNVHVRWLLGVVLYHLHRKDPRARTRYLRLKRRRSAGAARGAMMRWLATILWHMLTKQEAYRLGRKQEKATA
jgi:transposase